MVSNEESLCCLYSTLTTFFTFDILEKFFAEKINGEDGEISYIRSGDGEDEVLTKNEELGRRRTGNGEWGVGGWRWQIQMIIILIRVLN